ncbi:MAG: hypothetical protein A2269_06905 [Lentisphaerae bacterium RIFOXYA12_FULL_60_10]|nr:MAG: hypothetical protein A2269_06905 [Lentisphaerae bacterium RIFOXYA12_FULL_60_10]
MFYHLGPETGDLLWSIDDGSWTPTRWFDDYAPAFWRPSYRVLATGLTPGRHRLRVRVSMDQDPRSKGHWTRLAALLIR